MDTDGDCGMMSRREAEPTFTEPLVQNLARIVQGFYVCGGVYYNVFRRKCAKDGLFFNVHARAWLAPIDISIEIPHPCLPDVRRGNHRSDHTENWRLDADQQHTNSYFISTSRNTQVLRLSKTV
jgi:hypothetical protein